MAFPVPSHSTPSGKPRSAIERRLRNVGRIILVDTDPTDRAHVRRLLEQIGHVVTEADTGARGLVEARTHRYDLAVIASDLGSGAGGADICRRIKTLTRLHVLHVLVYTRSASGEVTESLFDAGCDAVVVPEQFGQMGHVASVLMSERARLEDLGDQNRTLEMENRRLEEKRQQEADSSAAKGGAGAEALLHRELAAGRPDGVMIADSRGVVMHADRGACEILGLQIVGRTLGSVVPASGLEAFVRDARTGARDGFRFEVSARKDRVRRSIMASVTPIASGDAVPSLRVVLLLDVDKRRAFGAELDQQNSAPIPRQQLGSLLEAAHTIYQPDAITGKSKAAQSLRRQIVEAAKQKRPLALIGERAAGKSLVARIVHYSGIATGTLLQLRCGSLSTENLERELFGYAKGAFHGAVADRPGLLLLSRDGTLVLSEVEGMPAETQQRLLEVLEKGVIRRRGAQRRERVECRLIVSASESLDVLVSSGRLLPELAARLAPDCIRVPRLCDRIEDLPELVHQFLLRFGGCGQVETIADEAYWLMQQYNWPGNVGELEDCIEQAAARAEGNTIEVKHLTRPLRDLHTELPLPELIPPVRRSTEAGATGPLLASANASDLPLNVWDITDEDPISLDFYEKQVLVRALHVCSGDRLAAARLLNVGKSTLYRKLKRFGIK
ncbi:MAG: response regulator [bacterium]|nr:response regulator [bacterium]